MALILDGTNGLSDVDGSAATPAIRGTDTNTGIFFPAADTIAFSEGGVESMRIDSAGNVGIGTSSPSSYNGSKLVSLGDVAAVASGESWYRTYSTSASTDRKIWRFGNTGDGAFAFQTVNDAYNAATERMRIDSSGNVGIGTSSPQSRLEIRQDQAGAITRIIANNNNATTGSGSSFDYYFGTTRLGGLTHAFSGSAYLGFDVWSGSAATERMRLDSSGNLGLGVTPSAWISSWKSVDVTSGGSSLYGTLAIGGVGVNAYFDSGLVWRYKTSFAAGRYEINSSGVHSWYTAPSGTAGNAITFTQAMTLESGGDWRLGATSGQSYTNLRTATISGSQGAVLDFSASAVGFGNNRVAQLYGGNGGFLAFSTGANDALVERMRIDSLGSFLVDATSTAVPNDGLVYLSRATTSVPRVRIGHASGTISGGAYIEFLLAGTSIGSITQSGTTAVAYNTSSDYRLKENIAPMTGALAKVAQLKPVTYKWKADGSDGQGFIAHELAEVVPDCVTGEKDAVDADGNPIYQGIDTSFLVATLTAAIQELNAKVDFLQTELNTLKGV